MKKRKNLVSDILNYNPNQRKMKEVKDHEICYGTSIPLCGQELGKKGLINDKKFITCPECLEKLNSVLCTYLESVV